jgi:hypothetical protein
MAKPAGDWLMWPTEAHRRTDSIREMTGDPEVAHVAEDDLYHDVINAIALGKCYLPQMCAAIVLNTKALDFERWCA